MLFEPGDIFEARVKRNEDKGAAQTWFHYPARASQFAEVICPIHEKHKRHVWVGVCPREAEGSTNAIVCRVLWADLNSTITTLEQAKAALEESGLPAPTMLVNSGNGFHVYWKLEKPVPAKDVRPWTKGVHKSLPADSTHDPTRVMRVPGTLNVKDPENPTRAHIVEYDPSRVYPIERFPKAEIAPPAAVPGAPAKRVSTKLSETDFNTFVANWVEGQKHNLAVAVAGYLRKNLYYSREECEAEIARIHAAAGYEMDDNLRKVVADTYAQPFATVAGVSKLREFGIFPKVHDALKITFSAPPKPKLQIIDFTEEINDQEFWIDGLVGPGLLTLWAAEPKTGKSFAAMQMGYALSTGNPLWDFATDGKRHKVLYFQGELTMQMVRQRAKNMFGLQAVRDPTWYAITAKPDEPIDLVRDPEILTDLAEPYDVVIVDPISVFHGNDENSSHSVKEVLSVFHSLQSAGKAVVLIHHTNKLRTDQNGMPVGVSFSNIRGSGTWFAAADSLALHYRISDRVTEVKFAFRAAPDRDPLKLYRLPNGGFTADFEEFREASREAGIPFTVAS